MLPIRPRPGRAVRRVPRRWPRSAIPWWIAVVLLATGTAATVHASLSRAAQAEARWDQTQSVVVATRSIGWGDDLSGAVEIRRLPVAAIPDGAISRMPENRVAATAIGRGEVLTAMRLSGEKAAGTAALLPPGTRALVVPLATPGLPVQIGDHIDLLAPTGRGLPIAEGRTVPGAVAVARSAMVVAVQPRTLVVALSETDASAVAAALGQGPLVPALTAPG